MQKANGKFKKRGKPKKQQKEEKKATAIPPVTQKRQVSEPYKSKD